MILPVDIKEVNDIVDSADEKELWIVGREFERPPYFHAGKGGDTRLSRALRVCVEGRITPNSDGSYTVEGSEHRTYRVSDSCSCPNSQKSSTKWCYHLVATWPVRRVATPPAARSPRGARHAAPRDMGMEEGTREYGGTPDPTPAASLPDSLLPSLPLPPVSVDDRLAQAAADARDHVFDALPTPEEDRMTEDPSPYMPEPDDAPVAVLDAPVTTPALRPVPPQVDDLEAALQVWTTERAVVQRFLKQELKPNVDYYTLRIGNKDSKPSLSKAGAEKVMGWLKLQASFTPDTGTWEMLGRPTDLVCFVCTLRTRSGEIVGEGRGARSLKKDGGDVNKAIKMAEKSANVSAILRTGALSDVFTQDAEDMQDEPAKPRPQPHPPRRNTASVSGRRCRRWVWLGPVASRSNAVRVVKRLGSKRVILIPDEYLAKYVASQTSVQIIAWKGHCEVHEKFSGEDVRQIRDAHPGAIVLAHPECPPDVLEEADFAGSTSALSTHVKEIRRPKVVLLTECSMSDNVAAKPRRGVREAMQPLPAHEAHHAGEHLRRARDHQARGHGRSRDRRARACGGRAHDQPQPLKQVNGNGRNR